MISVIVPAYNAESKIKGCLDSILNQNFGDFELIVIDDGSKDNTKSIIEEYSKKDKRIKAYYNTNHGVSYTRNFGIDKSKGDYITFVDADDLVDFDFLSTLIEDMIVLKTDMSSVGVVKEKVFNKSLYTSGECEIFENEEIQDQLFGLYEGFLWNKMYKKNLIGDLRLDENIAVCEDLLFNFEYLKRCKKVSYNTGKKYFYFQDSNSAVNRLDNSKWFDCLKVYKKITTITEKYLSSYAMLLCEALYRNRFIKNNNIDKEIKKEWNIIKPSFVKFTLKEKIKIYLFKLFPSVVMKYRRRKL